MTPGNTTLSLLYKGIIDTTATLLGHRVGIICPKRPLHERRGPCLTDGNCCRDSESLQCIVASLVSKEASTASPHALTPFALGASGECHGTIKLQYSLPRQRQGWLELKPDHKKTNRPQRPTGLWTRKSIAQPGAAYGRCKSPDSLTKGDPGPGWCRLLSVHQERAQTPERAMPGGQTCHLA